MPCDREKPKRRIMRSFSLEEISPVDTPAMDGARVVFAKRGTAKRTDEEPSTMPKRKGDDEMGKGGKLAGALMRRIESMESEDRSRADIVASMADAAGISESTVNQILEGAIDRPPDRRLSGFARVLDLDADRLMRLADEDAGNMGKREDDEMAEDLKKKLEAAEAELAIAKRYGELTDAEKAHHDKLPKKDAAAFLEKSADERRDLVAKAADADPVVYTSNDGTEFRKSDDARSIALAKRADEAENRLDAEIAKRESQELAKRAEADLAHYPGTTDARAALLKAVDGIENEEYRKAAREALAAGNSALSKAFEEPPGSSTAPAKGSPGEKLNALAKMRAEDKGESFEKAYSEVIVTQEGRALYEEVTSAA